MKRFRVHDFIFLYICVFFVVVGLSAFVRRGHGGRAFPSRLLEEFHSEAPDVREWNGDPLRSPSVPTPLPPRSLSHLPPRDGNTG